MKSISELPRHTGEIYVVGSGSSLDYINKAFFKDKITIGINCIYRYIPVTYTIAHHTSLIPEMIEKGFMAICPEFDMGIWGRKRANITGEYYMYRHLNNHLYDFSENHTDYNYLDFSEFDNPEMLVVGTTTVTAIHLAYRLGASTIVLVGVDGGTIDGKTNLNGYFTKTHPVHIRDSQVQIDLICNEIRRHGTNVYSLNPFNNFRLEGHRYE